MRPSRDTLAQAASGIMAKGGFAEDPPLPAPIFLADHSGALTLAAGILAAVVARDRTGEAQRVDASIYGTMIAMQGMEINYTSITDVEPERAGRGHQFLHGVWGAFPTKDGHICIAGVDDKRWPAFCKITGIEHLQNDPEYGDNVTRNFHGDKIQGVLDKIFPTKTSAEWLAQLNDADILATEVVDYHNMLKSEQARANGYLLELDHPVAGKVLISGAAGDDQWRGSVAGRDAAPEHGQHTEEITARRPATRGRTSGPAGRRRSIDAPVIHSGNLLLHQETYDEDPSG